MRTNDRKIYICGDIDHDAFKRFSKTITRMEDEGDEEIHIVLMSDGGDAQVALGFYDRIRQSPCVVSITGVGLVASAAALILVAPKDALHRSMTKNAWLMVHDDNVAVTGVSGGDRVVHARSKLDQLVKFEDQWNRLMAESTKGLSVFWKQLHEKETYLTAEQCLELGVISEII